MPVQVTEALGSDRAQRGDRTVVLPEVGLLRVAQGYASQPVLPEEHRLEDRDGDQHARRAQLTEHAAAEALEMRLGPGLPLVAEQPAAACPLGYRLAQGHAAVRQAVGDGTALGGGQPGSDHRRDDPDRVRRAVPHLNREIRIVQASKQVLGRLGRMIDNRIAVQGLPVRERRGGRRQIARTRVTVHCHGAGSGGASRAGGGQPGPHEQRVAEPHPRLHDQCPRGAMTSDEIAEAGRWPVHHPHRLTVSDPERARPWARCSALRSPVNRRRFSSS